ncbi:hypothetical protein PGQ11_012464 [Apiospora arundinis]|uniref:Uncharacterized protein n=1 Tax=Apiospora arundinis TaxID=335852 RepID=A0ABR2I2E3_9PEZI
MCIAPTNPRATEGSPPEFRFSGQHHWQVEMAPTVAPSSANHTSHEAPRERPSMDAGCPERSYYYGDKLPRSGDDGLVAAACDPGPKANILLRMARHCTAQPEELDALSAYWPAHAFENRNLPGCITLLILAQSSSLPESTVPRVLGGILGGGGAWCLASELVQTVQLQVRL